MANQMPIYSQVVPKSQYRAKGAKNRTRADFDPLNFNNGGNFPISNANPIDKDKEKVEREKVEKKERRKDETSRSRRKNDASEGKVEAYLKQYQVNIRQQQHQHRHSAVRQAEHRVNLRSLPLNEVTSSRGHDRTPTDRHRGFPERERDSTREHRRERERDRDRDRDLDFDGTPLSPIASRPQDSTRPVRKSSSAHRVTETTISTDKRRFFCREWAFQKIAHCLEQRPASKACGALILGDAGSGKTALCQELSEPGQGPQARQQRALNRRLLARHFLQSTTENSLRPGEFIRSLAMQILSHSSRRPRVGGEQRDETPPEIRRDSDEERIIQRFRDLGDDGEESSKPLLADTEDRTDEEDAGTGRRTRTIDRIHEREAYLDSMIDAASLSRVDDLPEIMPRSSVKNTNPFSDKDDCRLYENHENLFLRNISQRQSKELRNSRLTRQSSEPLNERKSNVLQKSLSTENNDSPKTDSQKSDSQKTDSPPKSRIPVANFRYPNKNDLKSAENSPKKTERSLKDELPEYQNVVNEVNDNFLEDAAQEEKNEDVPPPIPSLPVSPRTLIANAYYDKLLAEPEIQQALLPQNLDKNPDECFKKALLFPLLEIDPPKNCLFLLVDGVDEGTANGEDIEGSGSSSVATLLSRHQHLLPHWLLLVCTARPRPKRTSLSNMFTGFRKITLDELQRAHVSADVQRYVLARLDTESRLRARVSSDSTVAAAAAAALDHLRIKSDGCLLYLEKVLDGVADGFIALREIKEIPGTLNGLYLWLAQRLFHGRRFSKVRLLLDVLLAARCGVTEEMLYKCLLTKEYSVTRDDFNRRMHLLRRILVMEAGSGHVRLFHHSFSTWLGDVKHCTRRYLASPSDGHAALAMYYTLTATRLSALEIHNYVYHMTNLEKHLSSQKKNKSIEKQEGLDLHTLMLLWILDSGCDVESALRRDPDILPQIESKTEDKEVDPESEGKESSSGLQPSSLESIMPTLVSGAWPRDRKVLRTLLEMSRTPTHVATHDTDIQALLNTDEHIEIEVPQTDEIEDMMVYDPNAIHELVAKGDDETLTVLLKRYPQLVEATDASGGTALHAAARGGKAACAAALLKAGAAADAADADGWSPLRAAAWAGHTEVVDVLLEYGCDVDCVDADNRTALRAAAWSGHEGVVSRLLGAGAAPERGDAEGRTPLLAAAYMGHAGIVRALLAAGASVDRADHDGRTALSVASLCAMGAECTALLIEKGADVNKADRDRATPLLVAAFEGHTDICELLLEAEADIEAMDACGRTALWAAAAAGHARAVRLLLFWGACVDNMDAEGRTVLSTAAAQGASSLQRHLRAATGSGSGHRSYGRVRSHGAVGGGGGGSRAGGAAAAVLGSLRRQHGRRGTDGAEYRRSTSDICELLLEAEADIEAMDACGRTALWAAAAAGHARAVRLLLFWGACVDNMDAEGRTVLSTAAAQGNVEVVRQLLDRGLDEHHRDNSGWTPLHYAAFEGHVEVCEALLEAGAKVDESDNDGKGALLLAAQEGHTRLVETLVDNWHAPADQHAHDGKTALRLAALEGHFDTVSALYARGADPDSLDADRRSTLYVLALDNRLAMARYLLTQCEASVDTTDNEGRTPLHVSAWQGHTDMVNLLVKIGGAAVDARDRCMRTALHAASWRGRTLALRSLLTLGADPSALCTQGATPLGIAAQEGHEECVVWLLQHGADPMQADHCGRTPAKVAWRAGHANICRLLERWASPSAPVRDASAAPRPPSAGSPEYKRRSVHSSNSTKSSSNMTGGSARSHEQVEQTDHTTTQDKPNRANLSLSFAQQVARCGRSRRDKDREVPIPEHQAVEKDSKLSASNRSYVANERDKDLRVSCERDRRRDERHGACERDNASPLYASPPRSPVSDICSPTQPFASQPGSLTAAAAVAQPAQADTHFNRDTHMRIILGREKPQHERTESKGKRNGIVTNPAMRLVANVRNGLDSAAANIRRTGVALAASASSSNPAVKTNAFQWRKETPL